MANTILKCPWITLLSEISKDKKHSKLQWLVQKMQSPSDSAGPRGAAFHLIGIGVHGHLFPLQVWESAFLSLSQHLLKRLHSNREFSKPFSSQPSVNQKIRLIVHTNFYFQDVVWSKEYANLGKKESVKRVAGAAVGGVLSWICFRVWKNGKTRQWGPEAKENAIFRCGGLCLALILV